MKPIDIYNIVAENSFDLVVDRIINAVNEDDAREVAVSAALDELERRGLDGEPVFGLIRLEAWAASQWRRHAGLAAAA